MTDTIPETPDSERGDPLLRMRVYRLACELVRESWDDADELTNFRAMEKVSAQLYAAVGSIVANLSEGTDIDQVRTEPVFSSTPLAQRERARRGFAQPSPCWAWRLLRPDLKSSGKFAVCSQPSSLENETIRIDQNRETR